MLEFALISGATGPAPLVRPYRPTSGAASYPSTFEDLARSIIPLGNQTSTSPNQVARSKPFLLLTANGDEQIVIPQVNLTDKALDPVGFLSVRDNLNTIKEDLSLSVTQMAELFNVTRKAVYDWYDGAAPRTASIVRINALVEVLAAAPAEADMKRLKSMWRVPVADRSFLAVLNDERLDITNLRQALSDKLHQLSPRLATPIGPSIRSSAALGKAHLTDLDRQGDFT
jgi:DNA-binding transcriptional regulator YiaG